MAEPWTARTLGAGLSPDMRMKDLFDTAKAASGNPDTELEKLFAEESYQKWIGANSTLTIADDYLGEFGA